MARLVYLLLLSVSLVSSSVAQFVSVTNSTSVPIPGAGHDYINGISETVDPANGATSVRLQVPTPPGRRLSLPFAFTYDSNGVHFLQNYYAGVPSWGASIAVFNSGGWSYSIPQLSNILLTFQNLQGSSEKPSGTASSVNPDNVEICNTTTGYTFQDPSGGRHAFYLAHLYLNTLACQDAGWYEYDTSSDPQYSANLSVSANPRIADADGTVYNFGFDASDKGELVSSVEDRNGNFITVVPNSGQTGFSITDTVGRVMTVSNFGTTGNTVSVTNASQPYAITWGTATTNYTPNAIPVAPDAQCNSLTTDSETQAVVTAITLPNGQKYQFSYDSTYGELSKIIYPWGGYVSYTWGNPQSALAVYTNANGGPNSCLYTYDKPAITDRYVSFDGVTQAQHQHFVYSTTWNGSTWTSKQTIVTTYDLIRGTSFQTTYNYGSVLGPSVPDLPASPDNQITVEKSVVYQDTNGATLRTVNKTWTNQYELGSEQTILGNNLSSQIKYGYGAGAQVTEKVEYDFGASSITRKTITNYQAFAKTPIFPSGVSIFDRPCQQILYDNTNTRVAETDYLYDGGTTVCGTAGTQSLPSAGGSSLTSHDETNYGTSSSPPRGNPTKKIQWLNTSSSPPTSYSYDETGQLLSLTDPNSNTTQYSWADQFLSTNTGSFTTTAGGPPSGTVTNGFLTKITYPVVSGVNHILKYSYGYNDGELTTSTDENSQPTTYRFNDSLDRLTETDYPDTGQTTYTYNDTVPSLTTSKLLNTSGAKVTTVDVMDGVGHTTQTQLTTDPDGTTYTATSYDGEAKVYQAWSPTRCSPPTSNCGEGTWGITTYTYDALGRTTKLGEPDGSTVSTAYDISKTDSLSRAANCSTVTDEALNQRTSCSDGLGRMSSVWEAPTSLNYETDYVYNPLDVLTSVAQRGSNPSNPRARSFQYDSLARLTNAANPESGAIAYAYDSNGNLSTKTAPLPNQPTGSSTVTTNYTYDALSRLTGKSYVGLTTAAASYFYDQTSYDGLTIANGIGRRTGMSDGSGATAWSYDSMGRLLALRGKINGIANTASYTYTPYLNGEVSNLTYFSGSQVAFTWGGADRSLTAIDPYPINFVTKATYFPAGAMAGAAFGAYNTGFVGTIISNQYNDRLQPAVLSASSPTMTVFSLSYNFNQGTQSSPKDNGSVVTIQNNRDNTRTQAFTYDSFNRIASAQTPNSSLWGDTYVIDAWGNLTNKNMISGKTGGENLQMTALTNNQLAGMTYDIAGNLMNDGGGHAFVYDAENRLISAGGISYIYDGDGNRVEKCTAGSTAGTCASGATGTLYWRSKDGETLNESDLAASVWKRFVFFNGKMVARRDSSTGNVYYFYSDHLGSMGVVTDSLGQTIENESDYYPYGGERVITSALSDEHYKFTGKERDTESSLDNFGARYLSGNFGRFLRPDPNQASGFDHMDDPQSWDGYSYSGNNPLLYTDPDGLNYRVCDVYGVCSDLSNDEYEKWRNQSRDLQVSASGQISVQNADGSSTVLGNESYYNEKDSQAIQMLGMVSATLSDPRTIGAFYGGSALLGAGFSAAGAYEGGLTLLEFGGEAGSELAPSAGQVAQAQRVLAQDGRKAVEKAIRSLERQLAEHVDKIENTAGHTSSMEREVRNFKQLIEAYKQVLGR